MPSTDLLSNPRFPRSAGYNPEWLTAAVSGAANPLWLTEWLAEALDLRPGMRVLDLGNGRAASSIFLHRELGVQVWAADLWFSPSENLQRIRDAGCADGVFPIHADAHSLPFATEFFDAVVSFDSFMYYGTDDLYLNTIARFVKPGGVLAIALAGLVHEIEGAIPEHLQAWWAQDLPWPLHSAAWWRRHWERTGIVDIATADTMPEGWQFWRAWLEAIAPENRVEIDALEADRGRTLGYVRVVAHRRPDAPLYEPVSSIPAQYTLKPLLRENG